MDMVIIPIRGNPLSLPTFIHLCHLEPRIFAFGSLSFAPNLNFPEVACTWCKLDGGSITETVDTLSFNLAAIEDDLIEVLVKTDRDLSSNLDSIGSIFNDPREGWLFDSEAQRVYHMVSLEMSYFHYFP